MLHYLMWNWIGLHSRSKQRNSRCLLKLSASIIIWSLSAVSNACMHTSLASYHLQSLSIWFCHNISGVCKCFHMMMQIFFTSFKYFSCRQFIWLECTRGRGASPGRSPPAGWAPPPRWRAGGRALEAGQLLESCKQSIYFSQSRRGLTRAFFVIVKTDGGWW